MPLQHIDDRVLRRMNRRHTRSQTEAILDRLRATIPELFLRTTFIVGFPGETDEEFGRLAEFVEAKKFERMGVFTYSDEPGTPAFKLPGRVADEVRQNRREQLMAIQKPIAEAANERLVGQTLDVIVDSQGPGWGRSKTWLGRTFADAPDVDGVVLVQGRNLLPGDLVLCRIERTDGYDLIATALAEPDRPERPARKPRKTSGPGGPDKPRLPILG